MNLGYIQRIRYLQLHNQATQTQHPQHSGTNQADPHITPRTSVPRLFHSYKLSPLPGQPLSLQVAVRPFRLSSSAVPRPHGRGHWSSWRWVGERASSAGGDSVPSSPSDAADSLHACSVPAIFLLRCLALRSWSAAHASELSSGAATSECALVEVSISSAAARSAPDAKMHTRLCSCPVLVAARRSRSHDPGSWQHVCVVCAFVSEGFQSYT